MVKVPPQIRREALLRWHEANPFPFLNLPLELRELIICFAVDITLDSTWHNRRLPQERVVHQQINTRPSSDPPKLKFKPRSPKANAELILVNKQIHIEAMAALSTNTKIAFDDPGRLINFLKHNLQTSKTLSLTKKARSMRSIEIMFPHDKDILGLFGVPSRKPRQFEYYTLAGFLLHTHQDTNHFELKGIGIFFPNVNRRQHSCNQDSSHPAQSTHQQAFNEDILIGARPLLGKARIIELEGCINASQKEGWVQMIADDRRIGYLCGGIVSMAESSLGTEVSSLIASKSQLLNIIVPGHILKHTVPAVLGEN